MLDQRVRRWPNIKTTLVQRLVSAVMWMAALPEKDLHQSWICLLTHQAKYKYAHVFARSQFMFLEMQYSLDHQLKLNV